MKWSMSVMPRWGAMGDRRVDDHITTSKCSGMKADYTIVFYGI